MPRKVKPPETPQELLKLSPSLQADRVAKMYLDKCTSIEVFIFNSKVNRRILCGQYYAIKRFLMKNQESLVLLYSYLWTLPDDLKDIMDLTEVFARAQQWNQKLKLEADRGKACETSVETYEDYGKLLEKLLEVVK